MTPSEFLGFSGEFDSVGCCVGFLPSSVGVSGSYVLSQIQWPHSRRSVSSLPLALPFHSVNPVSSPRVQILFTAFPLASSVLGIKFILSRLFFLLSGFQPAFLSKKRVKLSASSALTAPLKGPACDSWAHSPFTKVFSGMSRTLARSEGSHSLVLRSPTFHRLQHLKYFKPMCFLSFITQTPFLNTETFEKQNTKKNDQKNTKNKREHSDSPATQRTAVAFSISFLSSSIPLLSFSFPSSRPSPVFLFVHIYYLNEPGRFSSYPLAALLDLPHATCSSASTSIIRHLPHLPSLPR